MAHLTLPHSIAAATAPRAQPREHGRRPLERNGACRVAAREVA